PVLLAAAVEEGRHVRGLLRLGDVELPHAVLREHLGECLWHVPLLEHDRCVEIVAIASHRRHVEARLQQPLRELARSIRAEVEEYRRVAGSVPRPTHADTRLRALVSYPLNVPCVESCACIRRLT